jgi:hypothetical protein
VFRFPINDVINDTPGSLSPEELDSTQGYINRSSTIAVTISSSDVASTLEQETEDETEPSQITSNDRVKPYAKTFRE